MDLLVDLALCAAGYALGTVRERTAWRERVASARRARLAARLREEQSRADVDAAVEQAIARYRHDTIIDLRDRGGR